MAYMETVMRDYGGAATTTWGPAASGDTFESVRFNGAGPLGSSIQVSGTFGSATAGIEGSNDGTTFYPLKALDGSAIAMTAGGIAELSTGVLFLRPTLSGAGASGVVFTLCARRG